MLPLDQLRKSVTQGEMLEWCLDKLQQLGIETTGWQNGRIQKSLMRLTALLGSDLTEAIRKLADGGYNDYATGDLLTAFSISRFQNYRLPAVKAKGPCTLQSTSTQPYTIQIGQLVATTPDGTKYKNTQGSTIPAGSPTAPSFTVVEFEAVLAGLEGSDPSRTINKLVTSLAGVSISNKDTAWPSVAGRDEEPDEILRTRNRTKWATMTVEMVRDSYVNIALANGAAKVHVQDTNPRGPGTLDVYVASETGPLGSIDMTAIQAAYAKRAWYTDATWVPDWTGNTTRVAVKPAVSNPLAIHATVYHDSNVIESIMQERGLKALREFVRVTPIGGYDYRPGPYNAIQREDIIDVLKDVEGVRTVILHSPVESYVVQAYDVVTLVEPLAITYIPVVT